MSTRSLIFASLACAVAAGMTVGASAETYPARPITMVVPYPAGGPTDTIARIVSERMRAALGQPIVIENVPGASGSTGAGRVARAAPDGYTLNFGTWNTHVVNGATLNLNYDVRNAFEPVGLVVHSPILLIANKAIPANNLKDFVAWLKTNPGTPLEGAPGIAGAQRLTSALFERMTGTRPQIVPYRGVGPAIQDMIAGRVHFMFDLVANSLPHLRAGSIRAYAILADRRLGVVPDVPTADEAGLPGLHVSSWQSIWAPKGTSKEMIAKLNAAIVDTLADVPTRKRLSELAQQIPLPAEQTPLALANLQKAEIEKWWPIIKEAGIKVK